MEQRVVTAKEVGWMLALGWTMVAEGQEVLKTTDGDYVVQNTGGLEAPPKGGWLGQPFPENF